MHSLLILVILAILVFGLGGILPNLLPACALAAVAALAILPAPVLPRLTRLWLGGFALLFWIALTLVPVPAFLVGPARNQAVVSVETAVTTLRELQAPPSNPDGVAEKLSTLAAAAEDARPADTCRAPLPLPRRFSLNFYGTIRFLLLAGGAWGMFWLAASAGETGRRRLLKGLVFGGAVVAGFGTVSHLRADPAGLLPWQLLQEFGTQTSVWPFINRNHFATFAAMLAPAALCLALMPSLTLGRHQPPDEDRSPLPRLHPLAAGLHLLRLNLERALWLFAFVVLVAAVFLSLSRGGTLALVTGVLVCVIYWLRGRQLGASTFATALGIAMILGLLFLPSSDVQQRISTLRDAKFDATGISRMQTWQDSVDLWRQYPLVGAGMDAFRSTFPQFRTAPRISSTLYAESEYVQFFAEGGLVGLALAVLLIVLYARAFAIPDPRREDYAYRDGDRDQFEADRRSRPLKAAVIGAAAAVALHAVFDFPLRVPLNSFLFATLLGLGVPLMALKRASPATQEAAPGLPACPWHRRLLLRTPAWLLAGLLVVLAATYGQASRQLDRFPNLAGRPIPELVTALECSPTQWQAWYELGRQAWDKSLPVPPATTPDPRPDNWGAEIAALLRPAPAARPPAAAPAPAAASSIPDPETFSAVAPEPVPAAVSSPEEQARQQRWRTFALDCLYQAAVYNPSDYRPWWSYAQLAVVYGNPKLAQRALQHAVRIAPYLAPDAEKLLRTKPK